MGPLTQGFLLRSFAFDDAGDGHVRHACDFGDVAKGRAGTVGLADRGVAGGDGTVCVATAGAALSNVGALIAHGMMGALPDPAPDVPARRRHLR